MPKDKHTHIGNDKLTEEARKLADVIRDYFDPNVCPGCASTVVIFAMYSFLLSMGADKEKVSELFAKVHDIYYFANTADEFIENLSRAMQVKESKTPVGVITVNSFEELVAILEKEMTNPTEN